MPAGGPEPGVVGVGLLDEVGGAVLAVGAVSPTTVGDAVGESVLPPAGEADVPVSVVLPILGVFEGILLGIFEGILLGLLLGTALGSDVLVSLMPCNTVGLDVTVDVDPLVGSSVNIVPLPLVGASVPVGSIVIPSTGDGVGTGVAPEMGGGDSIPTVGATVGEDVSAVGDGVSSVAVTVGLPV